MRKKSYFHCRADFSFIYRNIISADNDKTRCASHNPDLRVLCEMPPLHYNRSVKKGKNKIKIKSSENIRYRSHKLAQFRLL